MTIEEIRKNAPIGANYYYDAKGKVYYYKDKGFNKPCDVWRFGEWIPTGLIFKQYLKPL